MGTEWTEADQEKAAELLRDYRNASVMGNRDEQALLGKPLVALYKRGVVAKNEQHPLLDKGLLDEMKEVITQSLEVKEVVDDVADHVKETLVDKERVHPMADKAELTRNRLSPRKYGIKPYTRKVGEERVFYDKHAYGLFLPWEETPSCVVYTAQSPVQWKREDPGFFGNKLLPTDITEFRDKAGGTVQRPRYVMFYSISNITNELPGIRLGPVLLGELKGMLEKDLGEQHITYSTLSPIRSFPKWLHNELESKGDKIFTDSERAAVRELFGDDMTPSRLFNEQMPIEGKLVKIRDRELMEYTVAKENESGNLTPQQQRLFGQLRDDLCLEYLATAKTTRRKKELAQDDVADFHMSNGAYIGNIALQSGDAEWAKAGGLMVNYVYGADTKDNAQKYGSGDAIVMDKQLAERLQLRHRELGSAMPNIKQVFEPQCETAKLLISNGATGLGG
ncbi:MAG: malonyl-CoA decarboxylase family protein [Rickettsiales bacterium]|nr:malonyl-CoA decarboxylase family protein [Rickettsiales bacterium]